MIWKTLIQIAGIDKLNVVPNTSDPEHVHVKTILFIYSLESFLFKKLNLASRQKDSSVIATLGPFAVAISKIIDQVQKNRVDKMLEKGLPEILNVFTHFPEPDFSKGILQAIGYKEFWPYVKELNEDSLNISKKNLVT